MRSDLVAVDCNAHCGARERSWRSDPIASCSNGSSPSPTRSLRNRCRSSKPCCGSPYSRRREGPEALSARACRGREQRSTEIPVPRIASDARPRILQWLELEAGLPEPDGRAKSEQSLTIGRHEVRHLAPFPDVAV